MLRIVCRWVMLVCGGLLFLNLALGLVCAWGLWYLALPVPVGFSEAGYCAIVSVLCWRGMWWLFWE